MQDHTQHAGTRHKTDADLLSLASSSNSLKLNAAAPFKLLGWPALLRSSKLTSPLLASSAAARTKVSSLSPNPLLASVRTQNLRQGPLWLAIL